MTAPRWTAWDVALVGMTFAAAYALKRFYSEAGADELGWILRPTAALVEAGTGARFTPEAGIGYLSRERLFIIAKACAGVNFLIVAASAAVFAFVRTRRTVAGKLALVAGSIAGAYAVTLLANAARIALAVTLRGGPELHRAMGVAVYTFALCAAFVAARRALA